MDVVTVILIAFGLAMDAFSVSICSGMASRRMQVRYALRMAAFFGGFQMLMPALGWLGGSAFNRLISGIDHWIAFGLLAFVGGRMLYEALKGGSCEDAVNVASLRVLLLLSVATSIDALAVGLSLAFLQVSLVVPVLVIGAITFTLSLIGVALGKVAGSFFQGKVEIVGGLILIGIGIRILVSHLSPAFLS